MQIIFFLLLFLERNTNGGNVLIDELIFVESNKFLPDMDELIFVFL